MSEPGPGAAPRMAASRPADALRRMRDAASRRVQGALDAYVRPRIVPLRIEHVAGPRDVAYGEDDVLLMSIVRNAGAHLPSFLEHHLRLGVRHVVLLDNGSTDDTLAVARGFERLTLLRTTLPYRRYENVLKRYLARRFSRGRWNLVVDADERFDYPGSDRLALPDVVRYLNRGGYTAVVAQMLDLFPDCTLGELGRFDALPMEEAHVYYDTSAIRRTDYPFGTLPNPSVRMHWDGIRTTLFGTVHGLSKAALVRVEDEGDLFAYWHHAPRARVADFTCLLRHYPFAASFHAKVEDAVATLRYGAFSLSDYAPAWKALRERPETRLRRPTSRRWRGTDALVDEGFLVTSPAYRRRLDEARATAGAEADHD